VRLPIEFIWERYGKHQNEQSKFVQGATVFEDVVIRCVRYAFANIPAAVGRVFFSKWVALPFLRWRMLRHGYLTYPVHVEEVAFDQVGESWKGPVIHGLIVLSKTRKHVGYGSNATRNNRLISSSTISMVSHYLHREDYFRGRARGY
jgi:hypothetical protein